MSALVETDDGRTLGTIVVHAESEPHARERARALLDARLRGAGLLVGDRMLAQDTAVFTSHPEDPHDFMVWFTLRGRTWRLPVMIP